MFKYILASACFIVTLVGCDTGHRIATTTEYGALIVLGPSLADIMTPEEFNVKHEAQFKQVDRIVIDTILSFSFNGQRVDPRWLDDQMDRLGRFEFIVSQQIPPGAGWWELRDQAYGGYCDTIVGTYAHEMVTMLLWWKYGDWLQHRPVDQPTSLLYQIESNVSVLYN